MVSAAWVIRTRQSKEERQGGQLDRAIWNDGTLYKRKGDTTTAKRYGWKMQGSAVTPTPEGAGGVPGEAT